MSPYLHVLVLAAAVALVGGLFLSPVRRRIGAANDGWAWCGLAWGLVAVAGALVTGTGAIEPWIRSTVHRVTEFAALGGWWIVAVWAVVAAAGLTVESARTARGRAGRAAGRGRGDPLRRGRRGATGRGRRGQCGTTGGDRDTRPMTTVEERPEGALSVDVPGTGGQPGPEGSAGPDAPHAPRHAARALLLAGGAYLALAVLVWWNVWSSHPAGTTTCGCGDTSLMTWFLAWPAHAISHGLSPLFSTDLFHPGGVNLLANTAEVGLGVLLAPVTWLSGPIASLNVALTLSPALSALAMFVLLRRWVSWWPAAFVGGPALRVLTFCPHRVDRRSPDARIRRRSPAHRGLPRRAAGRSAATPGADRSRAGCPPDRAVLRGDRGACHRGGVRICRRGPRCRRSLGRRPPSSGPGRRPTPVRRNRVRRRSGNLGAPARVPGLVRARRPGASVRRHMGPGLADQPVRHDARTAGMAVAAAGPTPRAGPPVRWLPGADTLRRLFRDRAVRRAGRRCARVAPRQPALVLRGDRGALCLARARRAGGPLDPVAALRRLATTGQRDPEPLHPGDLFGRRGDARAHRRPHPPGGHSPARCSHRPRSRVPQRTVLGRSGGRSAGGRGRARADRGLLRPGSAPHRPAGGGAGVVPHGRPRSRTRSGGPGVPGALRLLPERDDLAGHQRDDLRHGGRGRPGSASVEGRVRAGRSGRDRRPLDLRDTPDRHPGRDHRDPGGVGRLGGDPGGAPGSRPAARLRASPPGPRHRGTDDRGHRSSAHADGRRLGVVGRSAHPARR